MSPFAMTLSALLFDIPWQQASYVLICMCSLVWLGKQFQSILSSLLSIVCYAMAACVGYVSFVFMRWTLMQGPIANADVVKSFVDTMMQSTFHAWTNHTKE